MNEPWSKEHKRVFKGCKFSLSNSFANPLSHKELIELTLERGDNELLEAFNNHSLEYTPNGGSADLRQEIANLYGPNITSENILVFPGAQVALQTAALALAKNCHSIILGGPGYQSVVQAPIQACNSTITNIPRCASNGWQVDVAQVEAAIQSGITRYLVLNEPYNPAGTLMKPEDQLKLKQLAEKHDIVILCDEVYRLLEHDPSIRLPAICDLYSKGISVVTMSKPWGGCGITIGWLAVQDMEIKQRLVDVQYFATACPSRASELQGIMTLRASDKILEKNLKIIRNNMNLLENFMERHGDFFEWVRPCAGAIAFIKFKGPMTSAELGEQLATKAGISIKPAYCFSDAVTPEIDYFRVGYGEEIMPKALEALETFVQTNKHNWK